MAVDKGSSSWPRIREKYVFLAGAVVFILICYSTFVLLPPAELSEKGRLLAQRLHGEVRAQLPQFEPAQLVLPPPNLYYGENGSFNAIHRHMGPGGEDIHAQIDRDRLKSKIDMEQPVGQIPRPKDAKQLIDDEINKVPAAPLGDQQQPPVLHSEKDVTSVDDAETQRRRQFIVNMTKFAWDGYAQYAWGENELRPNSKTGHSASIFGRSKLGATIIDAMDTLHIMGLQERFEAGRKFVEMSLNFDDIMGELSVFETNIRFVGGLLSLYALTGDDLYKRKVKDLADRLLPAFDTPTGLPFALINLKSKSVKNWGWATGGASILSEFGSLQLEFDYLSYITGESVYHEKVQRIRDFLDKMDKPDGLYYNYINPKSGKWGSRHVSMGALGDSFYEYLLKSWLQTGKQDAQPHDMYVATMNAFRGSLIVQSKGGLTYFAEQRGGRIDHKMDHLACFSGSFLRVVFDFFAGLNVQWRH